MDIKVRDLFKILWVSSDTLIHIVNSHLGESPLLKVECKDLNASKDAVYKCDGNFDPIPSLILDSMIGTFGFIGKELIIYVR